MKVLVVGSGGREHALCQALATARPRPTLLIAPGNPGTAALGTNHAVKADDVPGLVALARDEGVDLVVVGPELPLVKGLGDRLEEAGIPCCGPNRACARLEGSKTFTREIAARVGAPSPRFEVVRREAEITGMVDALMLGGAPVPVVKADGLAGGKGVTLPDTRDACLEDTYTLIHGRLGEAGATVVLEERLAGTEASLFYACHGTTVLALPHARDHKRLLDDDAGPNTGGMGAISPNPLIDDATEARVRADIVLPVLEALAADGTPFKGFLFVGVMLTPEGPKLLEFNVRLGDPEAQAILPRVADGQVLELCRRVATGELEGFELETDPRATCAVVLSAEGYPAAPRRGDPIEIGSALAGDDRWLVHAGTREEDGSLLTAGGRVAAVVARGEDAEQARREAYQGVDLVRWDGMHYRRDVGAPRTLPS